MVLVDEVSTGGDLCGVSDGYGHAQHAQQVGCLQHQDVLGICDGS